MISLSGKIWEKSLDFAEEAFQTDFIQGILTGTLDPTCYSAYMNQDTAYVIKAADFFGTVASRSTQDLQRFARDRQRSYIRYAEQLCKQFCIRDQSAILMGQAVENYCQFLHRVANGMDPLYFLVAMIPCARLWPWLAERIQNEQAENNLYSFWADENLSDSCARELELFVDQHESELDEQQVVEVYQTSMKAEVKFFQSATGTQFGEDTPHLAQMPPIRLAPS